MRQWILVLMLCVPLSVLAQGAEPTGPKPTMAPTTTTTTTLPPCSPGRSCTLSCTDGVKKTFTSAFQADQWKKSREPMVRCFLEEETR